MLRTAHHHLLLLRSALPPPRNTTSPPHHFLHRSPNTTTPSPRHFLHRPPNTTIPPPHQFIHRTPNTTTTPPHPLHRTPNITTPPPYRLIRKTPNTTTPPPHPFLHRTPNPRQRKKKCGKKGWLPKVLSKRHVIIVNLIFAYLSLGSIAVNLLDTMKEDTLKVLQGIEKSLISFNDKVMVREIMLWPGKSIFILTPPSPPAEAVPPPPPPAAAEAVPPPPPPAAAAAAAVPEPKGLLLPLVEYKEEKIFELRLKEMKSAIASQIADKAHIDEVVRILWDVLMDSFQWSAKNQQQNANEVLRQVLASQKQLENRYKAAEQASEDWYLRAQLALGKGDEDLVREALKRRKSYADNASALKAQLDQQKGVVDNLVSKTQPVLAVMYLVQYMPTMGYWLMDKIGAEGVEAAAQNGNTYSDFAPGEREG